jgi:hypothetical protein
MRTDSIQVDGELGVLLGQLGLLLLERPVLLGPASIDLVLVLARPPDHGRIAWQSILDEPRVSPMPPVVSLYEHGGYLRLLASRSLFQVQLVHIVERDGALEDALHVDPTSGLGVDLIGLGGAYRILHARLGRHGSTGRLSATADRQVAHAHATQTAALESELGHGSFDRHVTAHLNLLTSVVVVVFDLNPFEKRQKFEIDNMFICGISHKKCYSCRVSGWTRRLVSAEGGGCELVIDFHRT